MKELLACNWSIIDRHVQLVAADTGGRGIMTRDALFTGYWLTLLTLYIITDIIQSYTNWQRGEGSEDVMEMK